MSSQPTNWYQWRDGVNAALAVLGILEAVTPGAPGASGAPGPAGPAHDYARHHWWDPVGGVDSIRSGSFATPWKTITAWAQFWGPPTSLADFESPLFLHGMGSAPPSASSEALPPSRRIVLDVPGCRLPNLEYLLDDDLRFGSALLFDLCIRGVPGSYKFQLGAGAGMATVGTSAVGSLEIRNVFPAHGGAPYGVVLQDCHAPGDILIEDYAITPSGSLTTIRSFISGFLDVVPAGPGSTLLLSDDSVYTNGDLNLHMLLNARDTVFDAPVIVGSAPFVGLTDGVRGCRFTSASSFTGPPASLLADYTTRFWVAANGVVVSAGAGSFIESQAAWP